MLQFQITTTSQSLGTRKLGVDHGWAVCSFHICFILDPGLAVASFWNTARLMAEGKEDVVNHTLALKVS